MERLSVLRPRVTPPHSAPAHIEGKKRSDLSEPFVLLVDDEPAILEIAQEYLEAGGYRVLTALDGPEAIRLHGQFQEEIVAVVTDLCLPGVGGRELIGTLAARKPGLRVIGTSGGSPGTPPDSQRCGGYEFLPKPYTGEQLLEVLRRMLAA